MSALVIVAEIERLAARGPRPKRAIPRLLGGPPNQLIVTYAATAKATQDEARREELKSRRSLSQGQLREIFWAGVEKTDTCWVWRGELDRNGYGRVRWAGRRLAAHRVAWAISHGGRFPVGRQIRHDCGNRACVHPAHLLDP